MTTGHLSVSPLPSRTALDAYFLEARSKLLDLAGILDRIDRGGGNAEVGGDPRLARIREALQMLREENDGRAEQIQRIFSLDYDPNWQRPQPQ